MDTFLEPLNYLVDPKRALIAQIDTLVGYKWVAREGISNKVLILYEGVDLGHHGLLGFDYIVQGS